MKIPDVFGLKGMAIGVAAGFAAGTFGGGFIVHKVWLGKSQAAKIALLEADKSALQRDLTKSQEQAEKDAQRAQDESDARKRTDERLSQAYEDNARLAASRASTTTQIIREGEAIGQDLKDSYPCIYEPWPSELSDFTFGAPASRLPSPEARGYPLPE